MDDLLTPYPNGTGRTAAIVEFLASRPDQTFTLSEVARFCGLQKSTAHKILGTLHELGWVTRSPVDLRFGLGPTLIAIGQAAVETRPEVNLARPVMQRMAITFRRPCVLTTTLGLEILVLEVVGGTMRQGGAYAGQRVPLDAPFGTVFVAWQEDDRRREWYGRSSIVSEDEVKVLERLLTATRKRGYVITLHSDPRDRMAQIMGAVSSERTIHDVRRILKEQIAHLPAAAYLMDSNPGAGSLAVESIQAPIFDADGEVRYALSVGDIDSELDRKAVSRYGAQVRKAADEVTAAIQLHSS